MSFFLKFSLNIAIKRHIIGIYDYIISVMLSSFLLKIFLKCGIIGEQKILKLGVIICFSQCLLHFK